MSSRNVTKQQLSEALRAAGVDVPTSATLTQVRNLYDQTFPNDEPPSAEETSAVDNDADETSVYETSANEATAIPTSVCDPSECENFTCTTSVAVHSERTSAKPSGSQNLTSECTTASGIRSCTPANTIEHGDGPREKPMADAHVEEEQELRRLQQRKKIADLKKELAIAEAEPQLDRRVDFTDVENAVSAFTGDDSYGIRKWILDFEDVVHSLRCDERCKYLFARRLLQGTAKVLLRTVRADNWDDLRSILINEFDRRVSRHEVYRNLGQRFRRQDESLLHYVLIMQEIATQADIDDMELIEFIIDGLGDTPSNVSILYSARSIQELKRLLPRYEKRRVPRPTASSKNSSSHSATIPVNRNTTTSAAGQIRCFNCSAYGHIAANCPKEKRANGSCFRCGDPRHVYKNCPTTPSPRRVGAIKEEKLDEENFSEDELVQGLDAVQLSR